MNHPNLLPIATAMKHVCPKVLDLLKTNWNDSLSSYIKQVWQKPVTCSSRIAIQSRARFYSALKYFSASESIDFELAITEFERYPMLQTGPHCQLYANEVDFNAVLINWMGSKLNHLNYTFVLNSVTRTIQWSKRNGPAWLELKEGVINLFNLTPKQMSKLSVCSSYPGLTYCIEHFTKYLTGSNSCEKKGIEKLLASIEHKEYEGFISAFNLSNKNLLAQCDSAQEINPIILNDHFTSILVAEHLTDPDGIIYKLIFFSSQRSKLHQLINSLDQEKSNIFLKQGTEYFWGVRDNKIRSLQIKGKFLVEKTENPTKQFKISFDNQSIKNALKDGRLIPNIFLSFLVLCLMPQIRVLGGTRQIVYLPLIQKILCALLNPEIVEEQELIQELQANDLNIWGTNFIRDEATPLEWLGRLSKGQEFSSLSTYYLDKSLGQITRQLAIFKEHPTWKHII